MLTIGVVGGIIAKRSPNGSPGNGPCEAACVPCKLNNVRYLAYANKHQKRVLENRVIGSNQNSLRAMN